MQEEKEVIEGEEGQDEEVIEGEEGNEEKPVVIDRPAENLVAENQRKQREIEELRAKIDRSTSGYNPNDLTTWDDKQLYALRSAPDVAIEHKMRAEDVLMDRKVEKRMAKEREAQERNSFETKRIEEFPETLNPGHPMSVRMEKIARELRLDNSPSGLYAAARLAASEMKKPTRDVRKIASDEAERIAKIKAGKTSGDKPNRGPVPAGKETYATLLKKAGNDNDAFMEVLKAKGGGTARGVLKPLN